MYTLEFSNINYEVKKGGGKKTGYKTILNGLDGKLVGGEFTAIIGSSGSGKTTLLNILSGRIISGKLSGQVLFNGEKRVPQQFKRDVAYVEQEDLLYSGLTVQETLAYAAGFRLNSREYTKSEKMARADAMIQDLMLDKCKNSLVHDVNSRGISGGEKKRTSIGVEILSDPKLIMLDEPTSGLDSSNAETLVRLMKKITKDNDIISVASIHQPSARVFNLFDNVIILCSGKIIYSGPVNKSINYFASIGYSCPQYENPADFFINLITVDTQSPESIATSNERVKALIAGWDENNDKLGDLPVKICSKDVTPENFETVLGFKNSDMTSGLLEFCGEPKAKEYTEFDPRGIFSGNELGSSTDDEKQLFIKGKPVSMAGTGTGAGTGTQVELEIVSPPVARMEGDTPGGARSVGMLPSSTDTEFGKESKGGKALSETVVSTRNRLCGGAKQDRVDILGCCELVVSDRDAYGADANCRTEYHAAGAGKQDVSRIKLYSVGGDDETASCAGVEHGNAYWDLLFDKVPVRCVQILYIHRGCIYNDFVLIFICNANFGAQQVG